MNRGTILFRVDGSARDGMGRVARCLALANALQRRRYQMTFITQLEGNGWADRIRRFRHGVTRTPHAAGSPEDREAFLRDLTARSPLVVVTDAPAVDEEYLSAAADRAPVVISLDDAAEGRFSSDLVLNPTIGNAKGDYDLDAGTQLLLGDRYAMIRSEFRRARTVRATEPSGPVRVLLALGGGDNYQASLPIAKALLAQKRIEKVDMVVGCDPGDRSKYEDLAESNSGRITLTVDSRDLALRMSKAHLLVTGGGNTPLEAACVGIPMVLLARTDRHEVNAMQLDDIGAAQYVGRFGKADPKEVAAAAINVLEDNFERKAMSRTGRMLIDGRGADRIVTATEILLRRSKRVKPLALAA